MKRWLGALVVMLAVGVRAQQTVELKGTITPDKLGKHEMRTFNVPPGMQRMTVELESPGFQKGMYVTVGLWDPQRYRGEGRARFEITTVTATGPYIAGPLVPGEWKVALGYNWVAPGSNGEWTLRIRFSDKLDPEKYPALRTGAGWYKGDLHSHTAYTDAACKSQSGKTVPCPAWKLLEAASAQKLDFLAVTDHNTQSHFNELAQMQPYYDKLLMIAAEEMTTTRGHSNVWGTLGELDYRAWETGFTINDMFDQAHRQGALTSINHAYWPWDGKCPGCGWGWEPITDFSKVDAIEVLNGFHEKGSWFTPPPGNGIPFWEKRVAAGFRPTGVGGGDDHRGGEQLDIHDGVGIPTTVVYAAELSQPAILAGIKAGHVYVRTQGPDGPELLLHAGTAMMGDAISAKSGEAVVFTASTNDVKGLKLQWYVDGKAVDAPAPTDGKSSFSWNSDGKRHWVRVELTDGKSGSDPVVWTNPIYVNWH